MFWKLRTVETYEIQRTNKWKRNENLISLKWI